MRITLVGEGQKFSDLRSLVEASLSELDLSWLVELSTTDDPAYKMELGITENPALCIEETSIDFKDMIFEGTVPEKVELLSMFASILGTNEPDSACSDGSSCGSGGGCSGCNHW